MSALSVRWQRAQAIDPATIQPLPTLGSFAVPSQSVMGNYLVHVQLDAEGKLAASSCTCPDFGRTHLHGVPCCKHALAAAAKLRNPSPAAPDLSQLPAVRSLVYDRLAYEWCLEDADGWRYWGEDPKQCRRAYDEAMRVLGEHARKSGVPLAELREFRARERDWARQRADEVPA